jgi:hypothetical protein
MIRMSKYIYTLEANRAPIQIKKRKDEEEENENATVH